MQIDVQTCRNLNLLSQQSDGLVDFFSPVTQAGKKLLRRRLFCPFSCSTKLRKHYARLE